MREMSLVIERCDMVGNRVSGRVSPETMTRIQRGELEFMRMACSDIAVMYDQANSCFYRVRRVAV